MILGYSMIFKKVTSQSKCMYLDLEAHDIGKFCYITQDFPVNKVLQYCHNHTGLLVKRYYSATIITQDSCSEQGIYSVTIITLDKRRAFFQEYIYIKSINVYTIP